MNGKAVLIALSDDESVLATVTDVGERAGYKVVASVSASELSHACRQTAPELIVLDLQVSDTAGIEVLRDLADQAVQAGIVFVSDADCQAVAAAQAYADTEAQRIVATLDKPLQATELAARLKLEETATPLGAADLQAAIEQGDLRVHYQPTLRREDEGIWAVAGLEALLRWQHPDRGLLTPAAFIGLGEEHGLGRIMTEFVLHRGLEDLGRWQAQQLNVDLRINMSAMLITDTGFPGRLAQLLSAHGVDASRLVLEITETAVLEQAPGALETLAHLRVKGVNLSIDDFGSGCSSLTQLFSMPFNEMKIDKSLTMRTPKSREASIMIEALVDLAHKLNLTVCAEGVECAEALDFLNGIHCDAAQGFFVSRPVPAEQIPATIENWNDGQTNGLIANG